MATRPRTPTFRTQQSVRRVYETLQPRSEMKETPEAFLLHVYLPGFTKERVKITFLGSSRMVRITGERPIQGNRWNRFDQTYRVPENCEAETLEGKFDVGTLVVTMPKKHIIPQEAPKQRDESVPPPGDKKATHEEDTFPERQRHEDDTRLKALIPQETVEQEPPKSTLTTVAGDAPKEKHQEDIRLKARLAEVKKQLVATDVDDKVKEEEEEQERKPSDFREPANDVGNNTFKEAESPSNIENMSREDIIDILGNGIRQLASSASILVSKIAQGELKDEEKQLVVNMGAAVLVIAALGAYVSHRFASS